MLLANWMICSFLFFRSMEICMASSETFQIVTSTDTPCPGEFLGIPCLTLRQYSLNPSQSQNVTLLFEPKSIYNHSFTLTISSGYSFKMMSSNATIRCTDTSGGFRFNNVANIRISGMNFQRCHNALILDRVRAATVSHCNFTDNSATGSMYSRGSCVYLDRSYAVIRDSEFQNNRAQLEGGAIYSTYSGITIISSTFFNTSVAMSSGGVIGGMNSDVTVHNSTFIHNTAQESGGAIHCDGDYILPFISPSRFSAVNSVFINNKAIIAHGGAISVIGVVSQLVGCQFTDNYAGDSGGAIYNEGAGSTVTIDQSLFNNNRANACGGVLCLTGTRTSSVNVTNSSFINNTSVEAGGGAIFTNSRYANVGLFSSIFTNNSASYCGVVDIDNFNHLRVDFVNSTFMHNMATGLVTGGGVACVRNATIRVVDSTFISNTAVHYAGVFIIDESIVTIDDGLFWNNSARKDGGVFYTYVHSTEYTIQRSQFSENSAGEDGGVMFIGRMNCIVSINESVFDFNSAGERGGVIALVASSLYMDFNHTNIFNNTAPFGGVISACNSQVVLAGDHLTATVDTSLPICTLYGGQINITFPVAKNEITTIPSATTVSPTATGKLFSINTRGITTARVNPTATIPPMSTIQHLTATIPLTQPTILSTSPITTQCILQSAGMIECLITFDSVKNTVASSTKMVKPQPATEVSNGAIKTPLTYTMDVTNLTSTMRELDDINVSISTAETTIIVIMSLSIVATSISLITFCVLIAFLLFMCKKKSRKYNCSLQLQECNPDNFKNNDTELITMIN